MPSTSKRPSRPLSTPDNKHGLTHINPQSTTRTSRRRLDANTPQNILLFLIAFRALNALCVRTFFQPDEFFQSLEPAWNIAFGGDSGAWITWEWRHQLRSSIHPYLFATTYYLSNLISDYLSISPLSRADLLIATPKLTQALFSAIGDYYTWKLAGKVYGNNSYESWGALALTVLSPWQWFCSTRTLSNCLETSLTIVALYLWPWEWSSEKAPFQRKEASSKGKRSSSTTAQEDDLSGFLRLCLLLAAFACILRPTNLLIWMCLTAFAIFKKLSSSPQTGALSFLRPTSKELATLISGAVISGSFVLGISTLLDRIYYGFWTFPPLKFLYFNIAQSLAVFYGRNDWHYYISQGYPLLLTTALPFSLVGLFQALFRRQDGPSGQQNSMIRQLASVCTFMPAVLSLISHKEVRFIYPLLPSLLILSSPPVVKYFLPAFSRPLSNGPRRLLLIFLVLVNIYISYYTTLSHASGVINIMDYLRAQYNSHYLRGLPTELGSQPAASSLIPAAMTVGFLMPCHSTPWRSHLVFPGIQAWALSCEPPVNLNSTEKSDYLDEADQFYADPSTFLQKNMQGGLQDIPSKPSYQLNTQPSSSPANPTTTGTPTHPWPDYLTFFAQLEPALRTALRTSPYAECYRTWNTAWHDDWRRKGDVVVWCLDRTLQHAWREHLRLQYEASWERSMKERERQFDKIIDGFRKEGVFDGGAGGVMGEAAAWWERYSSRSRALFPSWSSLASAWPLSSLPFSYSSASSSYLHNSKKWYQVSWEWSWPSLASLQRKTRRWQLTWVTPWSWRGRRRQTTWPEWMRESPWVPDWDGFVKRSRSRWASRWKSGWGWRENRGLWS
ncbi:hypothetical protein AJ79_03991 [Helicocarpus griseus UAMH5409]|uniref:Mannosyltransferase n=1 Tax=Helicocarpus griseus UAMH5409 TaxID=1447875 RepID=A0A2B7XVV3_9EURO|nr:hypothetical protein AJ79_03991 [Helicocarpus griseus UAMH5409]